ncbi:hypothetical protein PSCLAVI8L_100166 [Pseudoclavibacter sp. 8L]|nr:hypothetical protein PSCLAVI8L_100166 [Pseudoclavibacter sp. 8L]
MDCGGNCLHGVRCKNLGLNNEVRPHDTRLSANPHVSDRLEWRTTIGDDDVLNPVGDFIFNLTEAGWAGKRGSGGDWCVGADPIVLHLDAV